MIEANGPGYWNKLSQREETFVWQRIEQKMLRQANAQVEATQGRSIEWHFAEREVADYVRAQFQYRDIPISVTHTPWRR
jgi:hypothetical protein